MELIGKLKKEVDGIDTKEGKREAIRRAGMLLSDGELEAVSGGFLEFRSCMSCPSYANYGGRDCLECPSYSDGI